jgi:hypothetical protein
MPFAILLIGAILVVTAFNNSFGALASELESDIPPYFRWAAAIAAILGIGYLPGLRTPSRYLLALVLLVILLANNSQIIAGLKAFFTGSGTPSGVGAGAANPSAGYVANPATTSPPPANTVAGNSGAAASPSILGGSVMGGLLSGGINLGSRLFGTGGAANPSTGSNLGLGN